MPQNLNYLDRFRGPDLASIDRARSSNALLQNQVDRLPQANRMQDQAIQAQDQAITSQQRQNAAGVLANRFAAVASSPRPRDAARMFIGGAEFQTAGKLLGLPIEQFAITDADDDATIQAQARTWAQALGKAIEAPPQPLQTMAGPNGSVLQVDPATGRMTSVLGREPQQPREPASEPLESVLGGDGKPVLVPRGQAAGMQPYQKPTGGLSPRDATTARNKLTMIRLARQQIAEARQAFQPIRGTFSAGALGQFVPTQAGQAFDAKVDLMRGTITGLKRVPGVGSMSDYETRLDQSMLPTRGRYEATTEQQLNDLDTMLNYMEQGYGGMLEDAGGSPQQGATAPDGTVITNGSQTLVKRNGQWMPQ